MRRRRVWMVLAALALVGGCAHPNPPQEVVVVPAHGRKAAVVERTPPVACSTTWLVLATVSKCGEGGFTFGTATE